jgi:peptide/nickel transport system substrate-binding protein
MSFDSFFRPLRTFASHLSRIIASFSHTERVIFFVLIWIFAISGIFALYRLNKQFMIVVPAHGGSYTEGIVGTPRFINPLLAISDADRDMTALIYAGLTRALPSGEIVPDLASSYNVSNDGLTYTFTLREGIRFHDGEPITANDIVFTITKAQDSTLKSPKRANWDGVSITAQDDHTVVFVLPRPYAPFLENTTLGILPEHIWGQTTNEEFSFSEYNTAPIGSGPYRVTGIKRDKTGLPSYYDLRAFKDYATGEAYISNIRVRLYRDEDALVSAYESGDIESVNAITPAIAKKLAERGVRVEKSPLPRVFGVFFNQDHASVFTDIAVREALDIAAPKERILDEVLYGYGSVLSGPIPPDSLGYTQEESTPVRSREERLAHARTVLEDNGWEWVANEDGTGTWTKTVKKERMTLSFSLATANVPELKAVADILVEEWGMLGVPVTLKVFDGTDLNQSVIRPRDYDALLFGEIVGRDTDLFAFWHSSQRNDPGLNIAMYANTTTDKLLEVSRASSDTTERISAYHKLVTEITDDVPAVFLYAPEFVYILPERILGVKTGSIVTSSERFTGMLSWHIETDRVWPIFLPDKETDSQQ